MFEFEAATQSHLARAVAFDEERADAESASDFVTGENASEGWRNNASYGMVFKQIGKSAAQLLGMLRMFENEGALDVGGAVAPAGEFKMAGADGADVFEELQNFFAFHCRCMLPTEHSVHGSSGA